MTLTSWREWAIRAAIVLGTGLFLAVIGAYGTGEQSFAMRAGFWIPVMAMGVACGETTVWLFRPLAPPRLHVLLYCALLAVAMSVPLTLAIAAYLRALGAPMRLGSLPPLFLMVVVISAAMTALGALMEKARRRPGDAAEDPAPAGEAAPADAFRTRLPPKLRGAELYALSAEDHYLRAHTSEGDALILMRLSDAERELARTGGLRVHRSWWVAEAGVDQVRPEPGGRAAIRLRNGAVAPVSRTYRPALRKAGWL